MSLKQRYQEAPLPAILVLLVLLMSRVTNASIQKRTKVLERRRQALSRSLGVILHDSLIVDGKIIKKFTIKMNLGFEDWLLKTMFSLIALGTFIDPHFLGSFSSGFVHQVQLCASFGAKIGVVVTTHVRAIPHIFRGGGGCFVGRELSGFVVAS